MSAQQEHRKGFRGPFSLLGLVGLGISISGTAAAQGQMVTAPVSPPDVFWSSLPTGHANPKQVLHMAVCLEPADRAGLEALADAVSNPKSDLYRKWLTPKQVGEKFGQPVAKVNAVISYLKAKGMTVKLSADNRFTILVDGTVSQVEKAFGTTINNYHALNEPMADRVDYFSFNGSVKVPSNIAPIVKYISGLQNHDKAIKNTTLSPSQTRTLYDLAPLYSALYHGEGRTIGISGWDSYLLSNISLYYNNFNLPVPAGGLLSNVRVVKIAGGHTGAPGFEGDIDNQMPLGIAPLANLVIYDSGSDLLPTLTLESNDNVADIISESYGWFGSDISYFASAHDIHLAMTLQGITYMAASGDNGTYDLNPSGTHYTPYPCIDPEVLIVGGTEATVTANGTRLSEVAWSQTETAGLAGTGGWTTLAADFNHLPSWQVGNGVPTDLDYRLVPDIAFQAAGDTGSYWIFFNGGLTSGYGTSFSSPMCAGSLALVEQKMIDAGVLHASAGKYRLGRIQDAIYAFNGDPTIFYDVTQGDVGPLPNGNRATAHTGWDFATGWGAVNFDQLANALGVAFTTVTDPALTASIWNGIGDVTTGSASNLATADGSDFTVKAISQRGLGMVAAAEIDFSTVKSGADIRTLVENIVLESQPRGTVNYVYVFNVVTSKWDLLSTTAYKGVALSIDVPLSKKYVAADQSVRTMIRALVPTRLATTPFTLAVDQAQLTEVYVTPKS